MDLLFQRRTAFQDQQIISVQFAGLKKVHKFTQILLDSQDTVRSKILHFLYLIVNIALYVVNNQII